MKTKNILQRRSVVAVLLLLSISVWSIFATARSYAVGISLTCILMGLNVLGAAGLLCSNEEGEVKDESTQ